MTVLVITGTGTGVGKTIATAALAGAVRQAGLAVAVCKPVQTGTADGDDDLAEVGRLSGVTELFAAARYPAPLAPVAAAEQAGMALPTRAELLALIRDGDQPGRLTLVEGAAWACWSSWPPTASPCVIWPSTSAPPYSWWSTLSWAP